MAMAISTHQVLLNLLEVTVTIVVVCIHQQSILMGVEGYSSSAGRLDVAAAANKSSAVPRMRGIAAPARQADTGAEMATISASSLVPADQAAAAISGTPVWREVGVAAGGGAATATSTSEASNIVQVEAGFMRWVSYMGSLQHSSYGVAQNKLVDHAYWLVDPTSHNTSTAAIQKRFSSIQAAINAVPDNNVVRTKIFIAPGTYTEKVFIPYTKPFITLQGSNSSATIIVWNDTASKKGADNNPIGTYNSATIAIDAPYFIARNITFKNTSPRPTPRSNNSQGVALRISGDAAVFLGCQFLGAQDTLYDHKGRHFFQDCYVEGSVDFIFGDGLSMYRNCHLHAIGAPYQAITAQNRGSPLDDSGFSFVNCKVTGSGPLYLGRAWGTFSRVVYSFTYMDDIVLPKGWNDWNDPKRQLTVYYGQFRCYGPGANASGRVSWSKELTIQEAEPFLELTFIDGDEWATSIYTP